MRNSNLSLKRANHNKHKQNNSQITVLFALKLWNFVDKIVRLCSVGLIGAENFIQNLIGIVFTFIAQKLFQQHDKLVDKQIV